jgi:hypothetical protein
MNDVALLGTGSLALEILADTFRRSPRPFGADGFLLPLPVDRSGGCRPSPLPTWMMFGSGGSATIEPIDG